MENQTPAPLFAAQTIETMASKEHLIAQVDRMHKAGYRLVQISATKKESYDLLYSFESPEGLVNLRLAVPIGDSIESISGLYPYAYLYENEIESLFGLSILHINVDFKGALYKTKIKTPYLQEQ